MRRKTVKSNVSEVLLKFREPRGKRVEKTRSKEKED
jgi:hypothetical protein